MGMVHLRFALVTNLARETLKKTALDGHAGNAATDAF